MKSVSLGLLLLGLRLRLGAVLDRPSYLSW